MCIDFTCEYLLKTPDLENPHASVKLTGVQPVECILEISLTKFYVHHLHPIPSCMLQNFHSGYLDHANKTSKTEA